MELREYTDFNQEEILSLYTSVGWENYTRNPQMLERAYENSFLKIAAFEGKQLIGMVRVVGDGASVILIQDLLVHPEYQRKCDGKQEEKNTWIHIHFILQSVFSPYAKRCRS